MRSLLKLALVILVTAGAASPTFGQPQTRIALLVANKDYKPGVGPLLNPLNDTRIVGEALKAVGFDVLKPVHNARRADMLLAVHDFAVKLKAAGAGAIGFLYYSGHGVASLGENYLLPIDLDEPSTRLLSVQGVKQSEVLDTLRKEAPNAAHYLVLDACRNSLQGSRGGKGFVPVEQQSGVLVAFSTAPGKTASDGGQGSSPYAAALAEEIVRPGQTDLIMFHRVRIAVIDKTKGDQVPWTEDGIQRRERVVFVSGARRAHVAEAERTWPWIKDTTDQAVMENFVKRFGDTPLGDRARARLADLKKQQVATVAPPKASAGPAQVPPATPPPPARPEQPRTDGPQAAPVIAARQAPAGNFDGKWTGAWGGTAGASIVITGNKATRYYYKGSPVPITRSSQTGSKLEFGSDTYTVTLTFTGQGTATAQWRHHVKGERASAALTRQ